jgi:hypothetical protein
MGIGAREEGSVNEDIKSRRKSGDTVTVKPGMYWI